MGEGWRASAGVRSELPLKANDHLMDATRYALHTALRPLADARSWMRAWLPVRAAPHAPSDGE